MFNPLAKTETVDAAGNATSSAASAALAVHEGTEHESASAIRRKLGRKGDRPIDFLSVELS